MSQAAAQDQVRVVVASDGSSAELIVPAAALRQGMDASTLQAIVRAQGVELGPGVMAAIDRLAADPDNAIDRRGVVARSTPPQNGADGRIEWTVGSSKADAGGAVNHYERSAFVMVEAGQEVGRVVPPTHGSDGRDVLGHNIPARAGKTVSVKTDESVALTSDGRLIAQRAGALSRHGEKVVVRDILKIDSYVDFSTGNIDFEGDVTVAKGIRDCFTVKTTGNLDVGGLIEAANLDVGGNLLARGGIAGREQGHIRVGHILTARYLDNVVAQVRGDLQLEREAINCDLVVQGNVHGPGGLVIGGRLLAVGQIQLSALGSAAGVHTHVILGSVPELEPLVGQLDELLKKLAERRGEIDAEMRRINLDRKRMTSVDKERQTELMFELNNADLRHNQGAAALEVLKETIQKRRTVDLRVGTCLYSGVTLQFGNFLYHLTHDLKGPIQIVMGPGGNLQYRAHGAGEPSPMNHVCEISGLPSARAA